jgi:hypothetical protein
LVSEQEIRMLVCPKLVILTIIQLFTIIEF